MFFNKSVFLVAAIVSGAVAAPIHARQTESASFNDQFPVSTCTADQLTPAIQGLVDFTNTINTGSEGSDPFAFLDAGKAALPGMITDIAAAQTALNAGDLATMAANVQTFADAFNSVPLDFQDGEVSPADENIASISGDILTACAAQLSS
ncbi:hypothetical protein B0H16DRAFT_1719316 [Mycena metata]|uniref:Uncharacterized protein n=1 Tax=Mycena metata TaxID=1033252 RepID=A0AAD7NHT9_9AGAR|nr:hypothetical protein B0H16DRAFT_1719316 [Mycena metata]